MVNKNLPWLVLLIFLNLTLNAQYNHFKVDIQKDLVLSFSAGITFAGGLYFKNKTPLPTSRDINILNKSQLNSFDRKVFNLPYQNKLLLSDLVLAGTGIASVSMLAVREAREDFLPLVIIYFQSISFTSGLTSISKATFMRFRPYVYEKNISSTKNSRDAVHSFFSGHTSSAAAFSFTSAYTFTRYIESNVIDNIIWGLAAIVPAYTGYLRMVSRKHFPTDIIIGYIVGGSIGIIIPKIHEIKTNNENVNLGLTGSGFYFTFNF